MRTTVSVRGRWRMAALVCAAAVATPACELLVQFDRSKIPQEGGVEADAGEALDGSSDAGLADATSGDATVDGSSDGALDSSLPDSSPADVVAADSTSDGAADAAEDSGDAQAADASGSDGADQ